MCDLDPPIMKCIIFIFNIFMSCSSPISEELILDLDKVKIFEFTRPKILKTCISQHGPISSLDLCLVFQKV